MNKSLQTVRVATWNVLAGRNPATWEVDLDAVAEGLKALDADVVALQEVDRLLARTGTVNQLREIADRAGYLPLYAPALLGTPGDRWETVGLPDPGGPAYGIGLLLRTPPVRWRRVTLPGGGAGVGRRAVRKTPGWDGEPRVAVQVQLSVGGVRLDVTATHLSYMPWRAARQLRTVVRATTGTPSLILGDLNLPPWAVQRLTSGWRTAGGDATYPADDPRIQVDHILGRGLYPRTATTRQFGVSDHRALVADIDL